LRLLVARRLYVRTGEDVKRPEATGGATPVVRERRTAWLDAPGRRSGLRIPPLWVFRDLLACQGGAIGTPFFLFTAGAPGAKKLFAEASAPSDVQTLAASDPTASSATLHGLANPGGTSARVHFDFGPTAAYGSTTAAETLGASVVPTPFDAVASGLVEGSTIHYRAVAASDFATVAGPDATVSIINEPPVVSIGDLGPVVHRRDLVSRPRCRSRSRSTSRQP
jgi:hypothetical protein